MNEEQLEKNLKEKFDRFSVDYKPNENMWTNIENELPERKKSSRKFILLIPLFLVGFCSIYYLSNSKSSTVIAEESKKSNDRFITQEDLQVQNILSEDKIDVNTNKVAPESIATTELNKEQDNNLIAHAPQRRPTRAKEKILTIDNRNVHDESNTSLQLTQPNELRTIVNALISTESISSINSSIKLQSREILSSELPFELMKPAANTFDKDDNRLSMGIWFGYNAVRSRYRLNDNAYSDILEERRTSERPLIQYRLGLELEYDLNEHWSIQSGLSYSFFQDESFFETETSRTDTILNYQMQTTTPTGMDTTLVGTAIKRYTKNSKVWDFTDRQLFSIPLLVNYNMLLGNKSKFGFALGIEKIFYSKILGHELDKNGEIYSLTTDKENRYGTKGANALLRLNYNFKLTKNWDLRLMANYKFALLSNYNSNAPIEKSFNTYGVTVGSHINF